MERLLIIEKIIKSYYIYLNNLYCIVNMKNKEIDEIDRSTITL